MSTSATAQKVLEMHPINSWQDVVPFADQIVVYKAHTFYYQGNAEPVSKNSGLRFAYVEDQELEDRSMSFAMSRLLKHNGVPCGCPLWTHILEKNPIEMRKATHSEIYKIAKAISAKQMNFEYESFFKTKIDAIFKKVFSDIALAMALRDTFRKP